MSDLQERALKRIFQLPELSEIQDDWKYCLKCRQEKKIVVSCECATCDNFEIGIVMNEIQDEDMEAALEIEREKEYENLWEEYFKRNERETF